jgi:nucleoside 2-deoxyribosyltransferase
MQITDSDRKWLSEMHRRSLAGEDMDPRVVRAALWNDVRKNFDPESIDRILLHDGELTLLGMWVADQESPVVKLVERIIYAIKRHLDNEPKRDKFASADLVDEVEADETSVQLAFKLLQDVGHFMNGASHGESENEYSTIHTEKEYVFREYKNFDGIDEKLTSMLERDPFYEPILPSNEAFVAMWFPDRENEPEEYKLMERVYEKIEEALLDRGFENRPFRVDKQQHNEAIPDRIIANIRRSSIVVADVTHSLETGMRGGVYYEAGFAMGLGRPVIWTARKETGLSFNTQGLNHIMWSPNDLEQLTSQLVARIEATVPERAELR